MINLDEIESKPKYDNVAGVYINNPNKTSYLMFLANEKVGKGKEFMEDIMDELYTAISLIGDYSVGNYRNISIKTYFLMLYTLITFVRPKNTLEKIPGVKIIKEISLLRLSLKSFRKDLIKYAEWKRNQVVPEV